MRKVQLQGTDLCRRVRYLSWSVTVKAHCQNHCQSQLLNVLDRDAGETDQRPDDVHQSRDGPREVKSFFYIGSLLLTAA